MRISRAAAAIAMICCAGIARADIVNGDFTNFTGGLPDNWICNVSGGGTPGERDTSSPDGSCWLFVPYGRIEQGNVGPTLLDGHTYRVTFLAASPQPVFQADFLLVRMFADNPTFDYLGGLEITTGLSTTWAPFSFEFTAGPASAGYAMYPYIVTHNGVTGIDNIHVNEVVTAIPGDFDGDNDVDGADFVAWQTNFPKASGATLAQGDADSDGDVDGADFVVWQTHFPTSGGSGVTTIPEPTSILPLMIGSILFGVLRCQRAKRRVAEAI
jgi:hypothetical protein